MEERHRQTYSQTLKEIDTHTQTQTYGRTVVNRQTDRPHRETDRQTTQTNRQRPDCQVSLGLSDQCSSSPLTMMNSSGCSCRSDDKMMMTLWRDFRLEDQTLNPHRERQIDKNYRKTRRPGN